VSDDLTWMMLASWMCTLGKILAPNSYTAMVVIAEHSDAMNFYHNKIVNGRSCIALQVSINSELSSLPRSQIFISS
jgi:hypothetical protein